ncbi:hypothetical protein Sste5344_008930 [Sporothrix stenoceras]
MIVRLVCFFTWYIHTAAGAQLFQGKPYIGSAEQHAEIDAITEAARSRRVEYAARLAETAQAQSTQSNLTAAINKHNNIAQSAVDEAQRLVATAMQHWAAALGHDVPTIRPSAAALLAELEAAERARNGTLYRTYKFDAPDSPIQQARGKREAEVKEKLKKREFERRRTRQTHHPFVRSLNFTGSGKGANGGNSDAAPSSYWLEQMAAAEHGHATFAPDAAHYKVFRNVKDYGAEGDGVTDDTAAINKAIIDGKRCGADCLSSTTQPALVYFPADTYLVSSTIIGYYQTQLVGNPNSRPTIRASSKFVGKDGTTGIISSDVYIDGGGGQKWYLETSNFYRQVRNEDLAKLGGRIGSRIDKIKTITSVYKA